MQQVDFTEIKGNCRKNNSAYGVQFLLEKVLDPGFLAFKKMRANLEIREGFYIKGARISKGQLYFKKEYSILNIYHKVSYSLTILPP